MQKPGAIAHNGSPVCSAALFSAQYSVVPQLTVFGSPRPMNCRLDASSTAYSALVRKLATIREVMVGMTSITMT